LGSFAASVRQLLQPGQHLEDVVDVDAEVPRAELLEVLGLQLEEAARPQTVRAFSSTVKSALRVVELASA
jgi:hypothetical protein